MKPGEMGVRSWEGKNNWWTHQTAETAASLCHHAYFCYLRLQSQLGQPQWKHRNGHLYPKWQTRLATLIFDGHVNARKHLGKWIWSFLSGQIDTHYRDHHQCTTIRSVWLWKHELQDTKQAGHDFCGTFSALASSSNCQHSHLPLAWSCCRGWERGLFAKLVCFHGWKGFWLVQMINYYHSLARTNELF